MDCTPLSLIAILKDLSRLDDRYYPRLGCADLETPTLSRATVGKQQIQPGRREEESTEVGNQPGTSKIFFKIHCSAY